MIQKIFQSEQRRGIFGYIGSAIFANIVNFLLTKYTTLNVQQTTFIAVYLVGNIIIYSFDILFAKKEFFLDSYKGGANYYGPVPYSDIQTRLIWLGKSLYQKYIFRFLITVILDTIIGLSLLKYAIFKLDEYKVLLNWKYRNIIVATIVSSFTFFLYLSTLRFKWAYEYKENNIMNILVMVWLSLAILITVDEKIINGKEPPNSSLKIIKFV